MNKILKKFRNNFLFRNFCFIFVSTKTNNMYTKEQFNEILGAETYFEETVNGSTINLNVDYDGGISIKLNGTNVYYGEDIETEEESEIELNKAYEKYVEVYTSLNNNTSKEFTKEFIEKKLSKNDGVFVLETEDDQLELFKVSSGKFLVIFNSQVFYAGVHIGYAVKKFNEFVEKYNMKNVE